MNKAFAFLLIMGALTSCRNQVDQARGVRYEIFVRSFADSNGDGIGDIKGVTAKLDYLRELGIQAIWLMPIMKSPSYHKYDVTDYKSVDPEYGSAADFKTLVAEAHKRGIQVIIDLVMNHTSSRHPWFQLALQDKNSPYHDYYVWAKKDSIRQSLLKKKVTLDSDNITQWHASGDDTIADHYYGFFSERMPDLNFDNPSVREEFVDIGKYWLADMGVDGFRLDAARYIFPSEREKDNHDFWVWFRSEMEKINPNVYLVGEVWTRTEDAVPYLKGLYSIFNFDLASAVVETVKQGKDSIGLVDRWKDINRQQRQASSHFVDAPFLKNHDQDRIMTVLGNNQNKARVAAGIVLTLPGTPYLYYGEEIGMKGRKPDEYIREPFVWDQGKADTMQTSWEQPIYSTDQTVVPLRQQKENPRSLYNFYKELIHFRNGSEVLNHGTIESSASKSPVVVSFISVYKESKLLTLHNISDVEVSMELEPNFNQIAFDFGHSAKLNGRQLKLPAYTTVIMK